MSWLPRSWWYCIVLRRGQRSRNPGPADAAGELGAVRVMTDRHRVVTPLVEDDPITLATFPPVGGPSEFHAQRRFYKNRAELQLVESRGKFYKANERTNDLAKLGKQYGWLLAISPDLKTYHKEVRVLNQKLRDEPAENEDERESIEQDMRAVQIEANRRFLRAKHARRTVFDVEGFFASNARKERKARRERKPRKERAQRQWMQSAARCCDPGT